MKILVIALLILGFSTYGYAMSRNVDPIITEKPTATQQEVPLSMDDIQGAEDKQPIELPYPVKVTIPKIEVDASVEHVGLDERKRMDTPEDFDKIGWYKLGYFPGERGSVVLAGHVDRKNGDPAVFANANVLTDGDEITVEDSMGKKYTYVVVDKELYPYDRVPLLRVFGANDFRRLNLITCSGTFDQEKENYSERLVVYAVLKEDLPEYPR